MHESTGETHDTQLFRMRQKWESMTVQELEKVQASIPAAYGEELKRFIQIRKEAECIDGTCDTESLASLARARQETVRTQAADLLRGAEKKA